MAERYSEEGEPVEGPIPILSVLWVLFRVSIVIVVWLMLFLAVFLGYLTIPMLVLSVFTAGYWSVNLVQSYRQRAARRRRLEVSHGRPTPR